MKKIYAKRKKEDEERQGIARQVERSDTDSLERLGDEYQGPKTKERKKDTLSPTSSTGHRLGLSYRKRAMFATSAAKASGLSVEGTNISVNYSA